MKSADAKTTDKRERKNKSNSRTLQNTTNSCFLQNSHCQQETSQLSLTIGSDIAKATIAFDEAVKSQVHCGQPLDYLFSEILYFGKPPDSCPDPT